jgi:hypothetical protein
MENTVTDKMITELTPEQEAQFEPTCKEWIDIGLATGPCNFEEAKKAVLMCYEAAGLAAPTRFFVAKSPVDAVRIIQELEPSFTAHEIYSSMIYGYQDASWLSFYSFFQKVVGIDFEGKLDGLFELAKHSGWLNVYDDTVVFQDRPEFFKFDDRNRLHCPDGPAIRFSDGVSIYAWHGTTIPADWIEKPGFLTAAMALGVQNTEQRRCACEILGWNTILKELNAVVIDEDEDPEIGTLLEVDIPEIGKEKFLRAQCGTKREFAMPVPPEMKTALEANAWTFGFDAETFLKPEVRT